MRSYDNQILGTPNRVTYVFICNEKHGTGHFNSTLTVEVNTTDPGDKDQIVLNKLHELIETDQGVTLDKWVYYTQHHPGELECAGIDFTYRDIKGITTFTYNRDCPGTTLPLIEMTNAVWGDGQFRNYLSNIFNI